MKRQFIKAPNRTNVSRPRAKEPTKAQSPGELAAEKTYLLKRAFWAYKVGKIPNSYSQISAFSTVTPEMKLSQNHAISPDVSREGFLLLLEAAHDWDSGKNPNFDAFAMMRLKQWKARTEIHLRDVTYGYSLAQEISRFEGFFNHNPGATLEDFAKAKEITLERAENLASASWQWNNSLKEANPSKIFYSSVKEDTAPLPGLSFDGTSTLYNLCPDILAEDADTLDKLELAFDLLSKEEAKVIRLRFGLEDEVESTYASVASSLKKSLSQIREIERGALLKLASIFGQADFAKRATLMEKTESEREFVEQNGSLLALLEPTEEFALRLNYGIGISYPLSSTELSFLFGRMRESLRSQIHESLLQMASSTACSPSGKKGPTGVLPFLRDNKKAIDSLPLIQKDILLLRFGLGNKKPLSGPETAKALSNGKKPLSREAIRQKEAEAIWMVFKATIEAKEEGALRKFIFQNSNLISCNLTPKEQRTLHMLLEPCPKAKNRVFPNPAERVLLGSGICKLLEATYVSKRNPKGKTESHIPKNRREFVSANSFLLSTLSPFAQMQLRLRYGMSDWSEHTHTQTMEALKLDSLSQTRNLISGALDELRKISNEYHNSLDLTASIAHLLRHNLHLLKTLPPKMEAAARLWSGAEQGKQHTTIEIANALNISMEQARYFQLRAYQFITKKLRRYAKKIEN